MINRNMSFVAGLLPDGRSRIPAICLAIIAGTMILTLSAKVQVPFYPVPMTLQTGAVLLIGIIFGARLGALTVLAYLFEGAIGIPVFAGTPEKGMGIAYLAGPTGGYLLGFIPAAFIAGWITSQTDRTLVVGSGMFAAMAAIYLPGAAWVTYLFGWSVALYSGILPFILGDLLKIIILIIFMHFSTTWLRRDHP
ncbi:MAG: biotin transporter BioY [Pseudomonadota bacterium]